MFWTRFFRAIRRRPDSQSPDVEQSVEQDIDDELLFHLRSLVDDDLARGMSFDSAWQNALRRFGSLRSYSDACRGIASRGRGLVQSFSAVGLVVLGLMVAWLLFEVRSLREDQVAVRQIPARQTAPGGQQASIERSVQLPTEQTVARRNDISGEVLDCQNRPLGDATVLVILKTWPGGHYRQDAFATRSDGHGQFRLPKLVPTEGQYAVQVAVLKSGYALTSNYHLELEGSHPTVAPVTLHCEEASTITVVVHDAEGRPVPNAVVVPFSRQSPGGDTHGVYFQASGPIRTVADAEGRVGLACFSTGDQAEIYVRVPGGDWEQHAISVSKPGEVVVVPAGRASHGDRDPADRQKPSRS